MDISILMSTRDRGAAILPAVQSLLEQRGCESEVIIIDQSASDGAERALEGAGALTHPRLRYYRVASRGVARSRNEGVRRARGTVVAFIDDDCVAPPSWAVELARRFAALPQLAVLYAAVVAAPELQGGWVPEFYPLREGFIHPTPAEVVRSIGICANCAARRSLLPAIGPFDEYLGPGGALGYGEDTDFGYRALRAGLQVYTGHEPAVLHYGLRQGQDTAVLGARYMRGMAVTLLKHVRCGDAALLAPVALEIGRYVGQGTGRLLRGKRPSGYRAAGAMLAGILASLGYGVDVRRRLYRPRALNR